MSRRAPERRACKATTTIGWALVALHAFSCTPSGGVAVFAPSEGEVAVAVGSARPVAIARRGYHRFPLPPGSHELAIRGPGGASRALRVVVDQSIVLVPATPQQCMVRLERSEGLLPQIAERHRVTGPLPLPLAVALEDLRVVECGSLELHAFQILRALGYEVPHVGGARVCGQSVSGTTTELTCNDRAMRELGAAGELRQLKKLDLEGTAVEDISPLERMTHLEVLSLDDTRVADLAALRGLKDLRELSLNGCPVRDLGPLSGLAALRRLSLRETRASDLRPLGALPALEFLDVSHTAVEDLSPLGGVTSLERLAAGRTRVRDLTPLGRLTRLKELDLRRTGARDLAPLRGLTRLEDLLLGGSQVVDVAPLGRLRSLQTLYLNDSRVGDLRPLAPLTAMKVLNLAGSRVRDLRPLTRMGELGVLYLAGTPVSDLAPLGRLRQLFSLDVSRTAVSDLGPLLGHDSLGTIGLVGLRIPPSQLQAIRRRNADVRLLLTQAQLDRENAPAR